MRVLQSEPDPSILLDPLKDYAWATQIHTVLHESDAIVTCLQEFHWERIVREWRSRLVARGDEGELAPDNREVHDFEGNNAK